VVNSEMATTIQTSRMIFVSSVRNFFPGAGTLLPWNDI